MKFWPTLTKQHLQIMYILTLLIYKPANTSSCLNVGTVIFGHMDTLACCLDHEKYATLVFRRLLNSVVAVPLQQVKGDAYICAFISFVQTSARTAAKAAPPPIARSFITALFDVSGGYLHTYLLPVTREAFYAGNARFVEVRRLYALYHDIKDYLHTNGQGWISPKGQYGINQKVRSLDIESVDREISACDNFLFNATGSSQDSSGFCVMPIPFFDNNKNPRSVALPLRYGTLHSLEAPESAFIILGHYVRSLRCLRERKVSSASFIDYNRKFRSWVVKYVIPRLGDEQWYPAFGGILRVLKKTGECIHVGEHSRTARKYKTAETRSRRQSKNYFNTASSMMINLEKDSLVNDVANDLIPIDTAVLQKLMQPTSAPIVKEAVDDSQVALIPSLVYFADTINKKLNLTKRLVNNKDEGRLVSTLRFSPTLAEIRKLMNRLQFQGKNTIDHDTSILRLVREETAYTNSKMRSSTESVNYETYKEESEYSKNNTTQKTDKFKEITNADTTQRKTTYEREILNEREQPVGNKYFSLQEHSTKLSTMDVKETPLNKDYLEDQELKVKGLTTLRPRKLENELQSLAPEISRLKDMLTGMTLEKESQKPDPELQNLKVSSGMSLKKGNNEFDIPQEATSQKSRNTKPLTEGVVKTKISLMNNVDPVIPEYKVLPEKESHGINAHTSKMKTTPGKIHTKNQMLSNVTVFSKSTTKASYILPIKKKSKFLVQSAVETTDEATLFVPVSQESSPDDSRDAGTWISSVMSNPPERSFSNLTDGCVHRTWDGIHAPAPFVSRLLAEVLESPAFNLDFLVCHILLSLFIWILFLCASAGQYECKLPCLLDLDCDKYDKVIHFKGGEASARPLLVQKTYYSLDGELPRVPGQKSILGGYRDSMFNMPVIQFGVSKESRDRATKEDITPLVQRFLPHDSLLVPNKHQQQHSIKTLSTNTEAQDQSLVPNTQNPLEVHSENSEVFSEDEECNQNTPKSSQ